MEWEHGLVGKIILSGQEIPSWVVVIKDLGVIASSTAVFLLQLNNVQKGEFWYVDVRWEISFTYRLATNSSNQDTQDASELAVVCKEAWYFTLRGWWGLILEGHLAKKSSEFYFYKAREQSMLCLFTCFHIMQTSCEICLRICYIRSTQLKFSHDFDKFKLCYTGTVQKIPMSLFLATLVSLWVLSPFFFMQSFPGTSVTTSSYGAIYKLLQAIEFNMKASMWKTIHDWPIRRESFQILDCPGHPLIW